MGVLKVGGIDFFGEKTEEAPTAVRRGHAHHSDGPADGSLRIIAGDYVLNGSSVYVGVCFAVDKLQISVPNLQRAFCILFDTRETDQLYGLHRRRDLLRVPNGSHHPGKN